MTIDRAVNIQLKAVPCIRDIFSRARIFKNSHQEILEEYQKLISNLPKGTPKWLKGYLRGRFETANEFHRELFTEFCYQIGGEWYTTHKESTRARLTDHQTVIKENIKGHFVYKDSDKIYF
jgi:hypothetical protein